MSAPVIQMLLDGDPGDGEVDVDDDVPAWVAHHEHVVGAVVALRADNGGDEYDGDGDAGEYAGVGYEDPPDEDRTFVVQLSKQVLANISPE